MQKTNSWRSLFARPENENLVGWQFLLAGMFAHFILLLGSDASLLELWAFVPYEFVLAIIALVLRSLLRCNFVLAWAYVHCVGLLMVLIYFYFTLTG